MKNISIFGTTSDSGKSTFTFVIAKILQDMGLKVAPFKAQNVSNNSRVTKDGHELAIAQYFQAEVLGLSPNVDFNPVLLKIEANKKSQVIVNGKVIQTVSPREYYKQIDKLKPEVTKAFKKLQNKYDVIVAEGAGSPVELNLIDKDLSNTFIANEFNTKIILVADIEKGGVFASIYGTYNLLNPKLKKNVVGVIINKFRGDISLFDEGVKIIENDFGLKVLGIVPYLPLNIGFEDSQSLINYATKNDTAKIKVGVINLPKMSNFNDFEPLINDSEIEVTFIRSNISLNEFDCIIVPGTKSTISDLMWLKNVGLFQSIQDYKGKIFGICGGYQMFFENIRDDLKVENPNSEVQEGFCFIKGDIIFKEQKVLKNGLYNIFGLEVNGYEIHNGISTTNELFYESEKISGTFVHGIFDNDNFREFYFKKIDYNYQGFNYKDFKTAIINNFITSIKNILDIDYIKKEII